MQFRLLVKHWKRLVAASLLALALLAAGIVGVVRAFPGVGAIGADRLRGVLGDATVSRMEAFMFKVDDGIKSLEFSLGVARPAAPWTVAPAPKQSLPAYAPVPVTGNPASNPPASPGAPVPVPQSRGQAGPPGSGNSSHAVLTAKPAPVWPPAGVSPLGSLTGEGVWVPYVTDASGRVVAYKTFLQPDPQRPYAVIAVVAFNLQTVQLHFRLGSQEPYERGVTRRANGAIQAQDKQPAMLLAAFNGGFKVEQGHFGAMQDGLTSVPPRESLATVAIYKDSTVRMGAWGSEITPSPDMVAYRQNGTLIVHNGQVTPQVDDPHLWGYTINWETVTWRSALGLDQSGEILYYFAGPYINIMTLAKAVTDLHVETAMQLDINNYWVHFDAFISNNGQLVPEPLLNDMRDGQYRFLARYARDFFYITAVR